MTPRRLFLIIPSLVVVLAACSTPSGSPSTTPAPASSTATPRASASASASASPDGTGGASPSADGSGSPSAEPEPSDDALGPFSCDVPVEGSGTAPRAQVTDVRVGTHDGYDRIVFEFVGADGGDAIPAFSVEAAEPPFMRDGSGLPVEIEGDDFLRVYLFGGSKVSPSGGVTYTGPTEFDEDMPRLDTLVETGDFEAISTWIAGLNAGEGCFRVTTLEAPGRLVVDLEH